MQKLKETHRKPVSKMVKPTFKAGKQKLKDCYTFKTPARPGK